MSVLFFLIEWHFFACIFTCHLIFLKSVSILPAFQKQHFATLKRTGVPPKEEKVSLLFFSNRMAFLQAFLRAISFFQSPFRFCLPSKSSILQG